MSPHNAEVTADEILRQDAKRQGVSLRKLGIIDDRRRRTIDEREVCFTPFFEHRRHARGHS
jgi:hypothetical protein